MTHPNEKALEHITDVILAQVDRHLMTRLIADVRAMGVNPIVLAAAQSKHVFSIQLRRILEREGEEGLIRLGVKSDELVENALSTLHTLISYDQNRRRKALAG